MEIAQYLSNYYAVNAGRNDLLIKYTTELQQFQKMALGNSGTSMVRLVKKKKNI